MDSLLVKSKAREVLKNWKVTQEQASTILKAGENINERSLLILDINQTLQNIFSNPRNVLGFMTMVNSNPYFAGRRPLDMIMDGDIDVMEEVANRIKFISAR